MSLTNTQLVNTFTANAGDLSGQQIVELLVGNGEYKNVQQIKQQLERAGFTKKGAEEAVTHQGPGFLKQLENAASGLLIVPGSAAEAIIGGGGADAAATEAGQAAEDDPTSPGTSPLSNGLSNLLGKYGGDLIFAPLIAWLMTGKNWVRVLEYVGGAAMILVALRSFANQ